MDETAARRETLPRWAVVSALLFVLALGGWLRLHNLSGACLFIDEITFCNESRLPSPVAIWKWMLGTYSWQHQPALPRIVEWVWLQLAQRIGLTPDEAVYRFPSALAGIASLPVMFALGRRLFGQRAGLLAAFLLSLSFFHVFHSRDAYNYTPFLFCMLLSWHALARVLDEMRERSRASWWSVIWFGVATALALQMVMAGIAYLFAVFLAIVAAAYARSFRDLLSQEKTKRLRPVLIAFAAAWIPFLPFLVQLFGYQTADQHVEQNVGLVSLVRMLGELGWGSHAMPLSVFLACVAGGAWFGLRDAQSRAACVQCLIIGFGSAIVIGYFERFGRFETRYFIPLLPALLLLSAVFLDRLTAAVRPFAVFVPCVALLIWHVPFYHQLFQLKAKAFCGRDVVEWLTKNTPAGAVCVFDNLYVRREVPGFYGVTERQFASPIGHKSPEDMKKMRTFLQEVFRRFPDCYYIDTLHTRIGDNGNEPDGWCRRIFRNHVRIENPALVRLFRMGIWPSGVFYPGMADPFYPNFATDIYFNTREDLIVLRQQAGEKAFATFGPEWSYLEVPLPQGGIEHWKGLRDRGSILVHGIGPQPVRLVLRMRCGSYRTAQTIHVKMSGRDMVFQLKADTAQWIELGEMTVQPGENSILVRKDAPQRSGELANLMVHEIMVRTIAEVGVR